MRTAIGFIGAAGTVHDHRHLAAGSPQPDESTEWARAQARGSALYLLCVLSGTLGAYGGGGFRHCVHR